MSSFFVFVSCCFWHHCQRKSSRFDRTDDHEPGPGRTRPLDRLDARPVTVSPARRVDVWTRMTCTAPNESMSPLVKVFGCRPLADGSARMGGRRRKTSKGGNRGKGDEGGSSRTMGI